jgi:predicted RNA-binding protein with PUA-like domain
MATRPKANHTPLKTVLASRQRPGGPRHWLMKSEPEVFGIAHLAGMGSSPWDGVRNYQARNFMREMEIGDQVLFYHSNAKPSGVAGVAEVSRTAYPDHTAWDSHSVHFDAGSTPENPRWWMVDVRFVRAFPRVLALDQLRARPELNEMLLFSRSRLSVQSVSPEHFAWVVQFAEGAENG